MRATTADTRPLTWARPLQNTTLTGHGFITSSAQSFVGTSVMLWDGRCLLRVRADAIPADSPQNAGLARLRLGFRREDQSTIWQPKILPSPDVWHWVAIEGLAAPERVRLVIDGVPHFQSPRVEVEVALRGERATTQ